MTNGKIRLSAYFGKNNLRQLRRKMLVLCDGTHWYAGVFTSDRGNEIGLESLNFMFY